MSANTGSATRSLPIGLVAAIAWVACYFGCRLALDTLAMPEWMRIVVALLPVVPFLVVLSFVIANVRTMDELHRRVHLEALAFAFPASITLLMILGLLQLVIELQSPRFNLRDVWPMMCTLYFVGLAWSWRRYK